MFRYNSRRKRKVGSAKQIPTAKIAMKCQPKPVIFKRRDSDFIQTVAMVAVMSKSHVNPEITQVANGAEKNSLHAVSPRLAKCRLKHNTGSRNPATDKVPYNKRIPNYIPFKVESIATSSLVFNEALAVAKRRAASLFAP